MLCLDTKEFIANLFYNLNHIEFYTHKTKKKTDPASQVKNVDLTESPERVKRSHLFLIFVEATLYCGNNVIGVSNPK